MTRVVNRVQGRVRAVEDPAVRDPAIQQGFLIARQIKQQAVDIQAGTRSDDKIVEEQAFVGRAAMAVVDIVHQFNHTHVRAPQRERPQGVVLGQTAVHKPRNLEETRVSRAAFDIAPSGRELAVITARAASPEAAMGSLGFIIVTLTVTAGIAGAPWLLPRCATTLGVYEARKSLGWAIFFAGAMIITLSALAMLFRGIIMTDLVGRSFVELPTWFDDLVTRGLASVGSGASLRQPA